MKEVVKKVIDTVIPPDTKCRYCGGELELWSARIKVCKLCERKQ